MAGDVPEIKDEGKTKQYLNKYKKISSNSHEYVNEFVQSDMDGKVHSALIY